MTSLWHSLLSSRGSTRTLNQNPATPDPTLDLLLQGGGAGATGGGSSGTIYSITTNADSGTGSLREALEATGSRHIVFHEKPSGPIVLTSRIENIQGNVSIWGETFGGELQIRMDGPRNSKGMGRIRSGNLIWRYTTFLRGMDDSDLSGIGGIWGVNAPGGGGSVSDIVFDHCTYVWAADDLTGCYPQEDNDVMQRYTWSNCIFSSSGQLTSINIGTDNTNGLAETITDMTVIRNLFVNQTHRAPKVSGQECKIVNNIIYNHKWRPSQWDQGADTDWIGNIWREGPESIGRSDICFRNLGTLNYAPWPPSVYITGNRGHETLTGVTPNQWGLIEEFNSAWSPTGNGLDTAYERLTPLDTAVPITVLGVDELWDHMASHVGNSRHRDANGNWVSHRGTLDTGWINDWLSNPGQLKGNSGTYVAQADHSPDTATAIGFPTPSFSGNYTSTGGDGLPDTWKAANPGKTLEEFCLGYTRS